jgi:hypothetical protein
MMAGKQKIMNNKKIADAENVTPQLYAIRNELLSHIYLFQIPCAFGSHVLQLC